jgi:hypothetical protein
MRRLAGLVLAAAACERAPAVEPAPSPSPVPVRVFGDAGPPKQVDTRTACDVLVVQVDATGYWIATGAPAVHCHGAGVDWLREELVAVRAALPGCEPELEVTGVGVTYQALITAMQGARDAGLTNAAIAVPGEAAASVAGLAVTAAPEHCRMPSGVVSRRSKPPPPPRPPRLGFPDDELRPTVRVTVTKDAIELDGGRRLATATLAGATGVIPEVVAALGRPASPDEVLILFADATTPVEVINRLLISFEAAGREHIAFATSPRAGP